MTTTQNLHLPQWEADDRIMRTDFNEAFSKLDAGVAGCPIVKLAEAALTGDGARLSVSLAGIDLNDYAKLELCATVNGTPVVIRANGISSGYNNSAGGNNSFSRVGYNGDYDSFPLIATFSGWDSCSLLCAVSYGAGMKAENLSGKLSLPDSFSLQSIDLVADNSYGYLLHAGTKAVLYGYRK